jgi:hypothetical protein
MVFGNRRTNLSGRSVTGALYAVETRIRDGTLTGEAKRAYRTQHAAPVVKHFFAWVDAQFADHGW